MFKFIAFLSGFCCVDDCGDKKQEISRNLEREPIKTVIPAKYKRKARSTQLAAIISRKRKVFELEKELLNLSIQSNDEKIESLIDNFDAWKHLGKRRKATL
ncbi:hypothetical protein BDAP_000405 [Binucleata daphniae]